MKIYTRTGDEGQTSMMGGGRVAKDHIRVEAYGAVDEINAFVGMALAKMAPDLYQDMYTDMYTDMITDLTQIQHELLDIGADLAQAGKQRKYKVTADQVNRLEAWIDKYDAECPEIQFFILPGGTSLSAILHLCRVVTRRAERRVVTLCHTEEIPKEVLRYLNRLSDFFFTLARAANARMNVEDVRYRSEK